MAEARAGVVVTRVPGTGPAELVLLPGWGFSGAVWQPWLPELLPLGGVSLVDWPGCGAAADREWPELPRLLEELAGQLPEGALLLGWSLGGMLAAELAAAWPARWRALLTIGSNGRFVAAGEWPAAMSPEDFQHFRDLMTADPDTGWRRFLLRVAQGDAASRELSRRLRQDYPRPPATALLRGLDLLATLDMAAALDRVTVPSAHWFGAADALVPVQAAADFRRRWPGHAQYIFPGAAHAPHISHCAEAAAVLREFLEGILREEAG